MSKKQFLWIASFLLFYFTLLSASPSPNGWQWHYDRGIELYQAGRYRAAMEEFSKAKESIVQVPMQVEVELDYYLASTAAKTLDRRAGERLDGFLQAHPGSIYGNDIKFARASLLYDKGDFAQALTQFREVSPQGLSAEERDQYYFKTAYSYFRLNDHASAANYFRQVSPLGKFAVHATYYTGYLDYIGGNYISAKRIFNTLIGDAAYGRVIPFYLLQIEFLEGNYDYVLREGDKLLAASQGERTAEIARIMGESWFHKANYERALHYMEVYRQSGGKMGREENYLVGFSQYMRNETAGAERSLSMVVGHDDRLTKNAAYHLGSLYLRTGDKQRAMQSFSMASGSGFDPDIREDALFNYGKLQYELGGGVFNEAINVLNRYIAEYPAGSRTGEAREFLVAAYYNSKNYEAAYEAIKQVPDPDNNLRTAFQKIAYFRAMEYYSRGDYDSALRLLDESLRNRFNPKYTALTQFWKGEILYREGKFDQARPLFTEYLSISPSSEWEYGMAQYNLGYCYFNVGRYGEARTWFDRFLAGGHAAGSLRADALNRVGDSYFATRDFARAISSYDAAETVGTQEKYYARFRRAVALGFTAGSGRKIEALRAIVNSGEGNYVDEALYELGTTYLAADRYNDAATTLTRFVETYPSSDKYLSALSSLGLAYQNMNDNRQALGYYRMVVEKAPSSPEARDAMIALKSIYVDMNDVDGYFNFASRSGVEVETGAQARDSLTFAAAERLVLSGNRERSIASLKDYLDKFPRGVYRPNALFTLSEAYKAESRTQEAITTLEELSDMYYNSYTVRGLESLCALAYGAGNFTVAAETYLKLASTAVNPRTVAEAYSGYLKSVTAGGDEGAVLAASERVLSQQNLPAETVRQATFAKAQALTGMGRNAEAMPLYRQLAGEVQTLEGAVSTYIVIESQYASGDVDGAEKAVMEFAAKNTPHSYWLAKAFLVLGDIYIQKGDTFQARATLQSIVDGYSPADDGIIEQARARIDSL
ncbi:MAG: tetratricopeptide repeat protein [Alistipes sp.]|nr:tetratricopeptide repeat protein [Alistipes sp.]